MGIRHLTLAMASAALLSLPALALADPFTITPSAVGEPGNAFSANFADFSYVSVVNQTATAGHGTFSEQGLGFFGSYRNDLGGTPINGGLGNNYNLYATFSASGTVAPASDGGVTATYTASSLKLFVDRSLDTTSSISGANVTATHTGDDVLVGQSTGLISGQAHAFPGLANGDFKMLVNFQPVGGFLSGNLTQANFNGVFSFPSLTGGDLQGSFTNASVTGSGNLSFAGGGGVVPEPTSLLLLGTGLVGLGWARRRMAR